MIAPRVSVVVAAYNYGRFLARAIESALRQEDYPADAIEVIVVDDGSTDDTPDVVVPYLDRVRYVRKENAGLLDTVNRGIAEATGELITFVSADDVALPRLVRTEVDVLQSRPAAGLVYSDLQVIDADGRCLAPSFFAVAGITPKRGRVYGELLKGNFISGGGMMVRAALAERFHPIPPQAIWEDWWIALRVAQAAEVEVVSQPLYGYRRHGTNLNLGSSGGDRLELVASELPFRRWLLARVEPGSATPGELVAALQQLEAYARAVAAHRAAPLTEILPVGPDDAAAAAAARAAAQAARAEGDVDTAVCRLVNAVAHDPLEHTARAALDGVLAPAAADPLEGLRTFAVLAHAGEVAADPALLRSWGATFGADDDATLVLYAPGAEPGHLIRDLGAAVAAAGFDDGGPDLLAVYQPSLEQRLERRTAAVLSRRPPAPGLELLPHVDGGGIPGLRALAEDVWASRAGSPVGG